MKTINHNTETLRQFLRISNAAFEFKNNISKALGITPTVSRMEVLHQLALQEVEKEYPDFHVLDRLIQEMEYEAEKNYENNKSD